MEWFYDLPPGFVEAGSIVLAVIIAVGLHVFVQRTVPYSRLAKHNEVAGFLFATIGVIYAVVLGFTVIVVWEKHDTAVQNALTEESALSDVYRLASVFAPPDRDALRREIRGYATMMIENEWPAMRGGREHEGTQLQGEKIAGLIQRLAPRGPAQTNAQAAMFGLEQRFLDARRERLRENQGAVIPILWWTLFIGGLCTVGFTYFFGTENQGMQLTMTAVIAVMLATMFVLVAELDHPFSGSISVPDSIWTTFVHDRVPQIR